MLSNPKLHPEVSLSLSLFLLCVAHAVLNCAWFLKSIPDRVSDSWQLQKRVAFLIKKWSQKFEGTSVQELKVYTQIYQALLSRGI